MDIPVGIILYESGDQFIAALQFCQENDVDVMDDTVCGMNCLIFFSLVDTIISIAHSLQEFGSLPIVLVCLVWNKVWSMILNSNGTVLVVYHIKANSQTIICL